MAPVSLTLLMAFPALVNTQSREVKCGHRQDCCAVSHVFKIDGNV